MTSTSPWLPAAEYVKTLAQATSYACLYFTDTAGRPLQLHSRYSLREPWQLPGGNRERDETPWACAVRECREETGIDYTGPQRLLGITFGRPGTDWPCDHIGFIFDGGQLTDEQVKGIVLSEEHTAVQVRTVGEWKAVMPPLSFARLTGIDRARRTGTVAYVEMTP